MQAKEMILWLLLYWTMGVPTMYIVHTPENVMQLGFAVLALFAGSGVLLTVLLFQPDILAKPKKKPFHASIVRYPPPPNMIIDITERAKKKFTREEKNNEEKKEITIIDTVTTDVDLSELYACDDGIFC
jgi:hypothetical protein